MSAIPAPRLRNDRRQILFWAAACALAFALAFVLGTVWTGKRTVQEGWIPTSAYQTATYP
jgi:hypothetical protein